MKKILTILLSVVLSVVGLAIMFYPTFSNWLQEESASYAVAEYLDQANQKSTVDTQAEFAAARAYNKTLSGDAASLLEAKENDDLGVVNQEYFNLLNQVNGIMGVLYIPTINLEMPIYHGTEESVLQKGVGHLEGSALPTGDEGNHTALTGHTGLPSAHLFTDLDQVEVGDKFYLQILDQGFSYEVEEINVVLPQDSSRLEVQPNRDLVTLITCTPYGINSHRLLVQGRRIDEPLPSELLPQVQEEVLVDTETKHESALDALPLLIPIAIGLVAILFLAIVVYLVISFRKSKREKK